MEDAPNILKSMAMVRFRIASGCARPNIPPKQELRNPLIDISELNKSVRIDGLEGFKIVKCLVG